mgnify:CR=1 FL=1
MRFRFRPVACCGFALIFQYDANVVVMTTKTPFLLVPAFRVAFWVLCLQLIALPCCKAFAAEGDLNATFGTAGKVITALGSGDARPWDLALQPDGKIVVVGESTNGSNTDFTVVRYNSDGSLDTSFSGDGKVFTDIGGCNDSASAVAIQSDGKIVVAGIASSASDYDFVVVRYLSNGKQDTTFNGTGAATSDFAGDDDRA